MAIDAYLKIDGIEGEAQDEKHPAEIEVLSFSWGLSQSGSMGSGGGGGGGKANHQDFSFTLQHCKASPKLMAACAAGTHVPKAVLSIRKAGGGESPGQDFLKFTYDDLLITSYQTGGSAGGDNPMDSCSFNYSKMEHSYAEQKKDGTLAPALKKNIDVKLNKVT
jgi:type VI secretion system secreted protein Hcp